MNRIEFMQSIIRKSNRTMVDDIVDFFDHEMLLYELIGSANSTVTVTRTTAKNISFHIDGNKNDITYLDTHLFSVCANPLVPYDRPLAVKYNVTSDKSMDITITTI